VKIAYIGDFINHGKSLQTSGTPLIILLSLRSDVTSIDVYCPYLNDEIEEFEIPQKVRILSSYKYDDPVSIIKLIKIPWYNYDKVIFNLLPTGYGQSLLTNFIALNMPLILTKLLKIKNVEIIYHNSVFTNNIQLLGYDTGLDRVKSFFLGIVERKLFKSVKTMVFLNLYKKRIDSSIGKNKVEVYQARYLEAITTSYQNKILECDHIEREKNSVPIILMHGNWGPQKNIDLALSALNDLKKEGLEFKLIISGGVNHHFPGYEKKFTQLIQSNKNIINKYMGIVNEKDIMNNFLKADLLILPYKAPGGHSGVLEQAIFFELPTVAMDFPEYREQVYGSKNIKLTDITKLVSAIESCITNLNKEKYVSINTKLCDALKNIDEILK
jgi:glycosyltransferase involved in cell wall biosynthesis